ncbi:PHP domain-containing protein [Moorella sp. Hama-1]|uniref:PHP domain-containing protein n=1 Tax=Moorella sp. Hama-1 TaxID=2138101 RepID=UPI000D64E049|nr:PHP domain-containing protein [Moorella sp. Hama-1]MDN5361503.1 3,5-nucleoside bisphosphate phosphatase [Moorella sp. (in: firmicutes)]BCV21173.1 PHP-like protein [Moorella sp. Hama-1]
MAADLHTHTTASDGHLSPAELVHLAGEKGLAALGITDHDTVSGLAEALAAGQETGLPVIAGIELSTESEGREVHLLGYGLDWHQKDLLAFLATMRRARYQRSRKIIARLQDLGYDLQMADVEQEVRGEAMGRPHIAAAMVHKGYLPSVDAAFKTLLERGRPAYVPRTRVPPARAVAIILKARGLPVLAHPGLSRVDDLIPGLVAAGLQGLEVYYPYHDAAAIAHYRRIAVTYNLVITGGSDFHGRPGDTHADLGACAINTADLERLVERLQKIKEQATKEWAPGIYFNK